MKNTFYDLTNPQKNILELQSVNADDESITHILAILKLKYPIDVNLFKKGKSTVQERRNLLEEQREKLIEKKNNINATIKRLDYKLELYDDIISGKRKDFTETI